MRTPDSKEHWTETLFVKHPELFLPWMDSMKQYAAGESEGLRKIFEKYKLRQGSRILDLQSGIGRISINLAKAGFQIAGVDISPFYLGLAKKWAIKENLGDRVRFYKVDSRNLEASLKKTPEFDAVINIGTSMGYFDEKNDIRMFRSARNLTRPHGLLVIETVNRDALIKNFHPQSTLRSDNIEWHEDRKLNLETSRMENIWRFYKITGHSLRLVSELPMSHRVYSLHELKHLVEKTGWKYQESYSSLRDLTPPTTDSFHITIVAQNKS
jgi:SAM-dependent methyltransferase